jgi:hypothetical protein
LQRAAFHVQAVQFSDRLGRVIAGPEFHESETTRPSCFAIGNNASRRHLISFRNEKLLEAVIGHSEGEIPNVEFCHAFFLYLSLSTFPKAQEQMVVILDRKIIFFLQS